MAAITCPQCGEENLSRAKFCLECGSRITLGVGERRLVAVLFADLSGFTAYSERTDIEEVRALADQAAVDLSEIVRRHGGSVDKIIGDAVMAVFGVPTTHEDDPERAVRAALQMQELFRRNTEKFARLALTIGVHTGEVMYGSVGPGGQYTVIGDTVNTASRIQSAASKGEILVGSGTHRATEDIFEYEAMEPIVAKNKAKPVRVWRVLGLKEMPKGRRRAVAPLVGREAEMDRLLELWQRVRADRRPYMATILGATGVGKSRLVREMTDRVKEHAGVLWGHCLSYGEGITYWPVVEMLRVSADILLQDDPEVVSKKLGLFLESLGTDDLDELRTMASALANLIGAPTTPKGTYEAGKISKAELHWGIRRIFQLLAERQPQVLVFDDLHWAEEQLLEFVQFLLQGEMGRLLIMGTARLEFKEQGGDFLAPGPDRRSIELHPLSDDQSKLLLEELFGQVGLDEEQARPLLEAAQGNPLFLQETVGLFADTGLIDGDGKPVIGKDGKLPVAGSLRALIASRLDGLPDRQRHLAEQASVIGNVFWSGAVAFLLDDGDDVERSLQELAGRDVMLAHETSTVGGQNEYAFRHILFRDVAYDRLPKSTRAVLHSRCADWIHFLPGGSEEFVEIVAYHLEQTCSLAREVRTTMDVPVLEAVRALTQAGEKAESREGTDEADRYYGRALDLLGSSMPETSAELRLKRSRVTASRGDLGLASTELLEVAQEALSIDRVDLRCEALLTLGFIDVLHGRGSEALQRLTEAQEIAVRTDDRRLQIRSALELATYREHLEGSFGSAAEGLNEAILMAGETGDLYSQVIGNLRLGTLFLNSGDLAGAEEKFEAANELAGGMGSLRDQARASYFLGMVRYYRRGSGEAEVLVEQAVQWLERVADNPTRLQALKTLAQFAITSDQLELAEERLLEALPLALVIGGWLVCDVYRYLAEVKARQGDPIEARKAARAAGEHASDEHRYAQAATLIAGAFAAISEGDSAAARRDLSKAIPMLEEQGFVIDEAEGRVAYAWILHRCGDISSAAEELRRAEQIFLDMGAGARARQVRQTQAESAAVPPR